MVPARIVWRTKRGQQLPGERKARRRAGEAVERGDLNGRGRCPASFSGALACSHLTAFGDDEMGDVFEALAYPSRTWPGSRRRDSVETVQVAQPKRCAGLLIIRGYIEQLDRVFYGI